jgi:hypothetical protein
MRPANKLKSMSKDEMWSRIVDLGRSAMRRGGEVGCICQVTGALLEGPQSIREEGRGGSEPRHRGFRRQYTQTQCACRTMEIKYVARFVAQTHFRFCHSHGTEAKCAKDHQR